MGIFDRTCALSGLSTSWPGTKGPLTEVAIDRMQTKAYVELDLGSSVRCSVVLLQDGVPITLPVSGFYDFYGGIVLAKSREPAPPSPHAAWVGQQLRALWDRGELVAESEAAPTDAVEFFKLADDGGLELDGTTLVPCLYLDEVAAVVALPPASEVERALVDGDSTAVYADWLESHGRPKHAAFVRACGAPPEGSREVWRLFDGVLRWVEPRGFGANDGGEQHTNAQIRETAHRAWKIGHPGLQKLIHKARPAWTAKWATADDVIRQHEAVLNAKPAKAYRPGDAYTVGDVIEHPKFGRGSVEQLVTPNKITVRFRDDSKLLVHKPV